MLCSFFRALFQIDVKKTSFWSWLFLHYLVWLFNGITTNNKKGKHFSCFLLRKIIDPARIRTWSPLIHSQMSYPLLTIIHKLYSLKKGRGYLLFFQGSFSNWHWATVPLLLLFFYIYLMLAIIYKFYSLKKKTSSVLFSGHFWRLTFYKTFFYLGWRPFNYPILTE